MSTVRRKPAVRKPNTLFKPPTLEEALADRDLIPTIKEEFDIACTGIMEDLKAAIADELTTNVQHDLVCGIADRIADLRFGGEVLIMLAEKLHAQENLSNVVDFPLEKRLADDAAAEHTLAVVQYSGLAGRDAALRLG